jgi:hypothetical protein
MGYVPSENGHVGWYGEFSASHSWMPTRLVGITRKELEIQPEPQPA